MKVVHASMVVYDEGMFNTGDTILAVYADFFARIEEGPVTVPSLASGKPDLRTFYTRLSVGINLGILALLVEAGYVLVDQVGSGWVIQGNEAL